VLAGGAEWRCDMELGALTPHEAKIMAARINTILAG